MDDTVGPAASAATMHAQPGWKTDPRDLQIGEVRDRSPALSVRHLGKTYRGRGRPVEAVADLNFDVAPGEFVSIVGPSGCGKSTLLRMISGLLTPSRGDVRANGQLVSGPAPGLVLVFQEYGRSLCPWRTAERNVELAIRGRRRSAKREAVAQALGAVHLSEFAHSYPWELSGGMQQRLQIARALAFDPEILVMDEPFGSLDALTRYDLEDELLNVWQDTQRTIIFVTHDIDEAVYLSDRVIVVSHRPARTCAEVQIDLARPRRRVETRNDPRFGELRTTLLDLIGSRTARSTPHDLSSDETAQ